MTKVSFSPTSNRYTKQDLFDNIETVWEHYGRQPKSGEMNASPSKITMGTYFNRFGSWKSAVVEYVKFKNGGEVIMDYGVKQKTKRKNFTNSDRYNIFNRDNFKCVICGDSPAISNTTLEIDHIIPISKGGSNNYENLQTLCKRCNAGKAAKPKRNSN